MLPPKPMITLAAIAGGFIGVWRANYGRFLLKYSDNIVLCAFILASRSSGWLAAPFSVGVPPLRLRMMRPSIA